MLAWGQPVPSRGLEKPCAVLEIFVGAGERSKLTREQMAERAGSTEGSAAVFP